MYEIIINMYSLIISGIADVSKRDTIPSLDIISGTS